MNALPVWPPVKTVLLIVSMGDAENVPCCAGIVLISVPSAPGLKREGRYIIKTCAPFVLKFARLVPQHAGNMPCTTTLAKSAWRHVKNVP